MVDIERRKELFEFLKTSTHLLSIFLLGFIVVADNVLAGKKFELEEQVPEPMRDHKAACELEEVSVRQVSQSFEKHTMITRAERRTSQRQHA